MHKSARQMEDMYIKNSVEISPTISDTFSFDTTYMFFHHTIKNGKTQCQESEWLPV